LAAIDKAVGRFRTIPADFTWEELKRLLAHFGYFEQKGKGSRRKFKADGLPTLLLHEPHPGKLVKQYALRYVHDVLESEGIL